MGITPGGQVTISLEVRELLGIVPSSEVEFVREDGRFSLRKRKPGQSHRLKTSSRVRGRADAGMSTDAILRLIAPDAAR